jgi:hypothetical protein
MAFKRHIDHLPIIPKDAKEFNVVCHYCIVGCGYKAWSGNVARAPVAQRFRLLQLVRRDGRIIRRKTPKRHRVAGWSVWPDRVRRVSHH